MDQLSCDSDGWEESATDGEPKPNFRATLAKASLWMTPATTLFIVCQKEGFLNQLPVAAGPVAWTTPFIVVHATIISALLGLQGAIASVVQHRFPGAAKVLFALMMIQVPLMILGMLWAFP